MKASAAFYTPGAEIAYQGWNWGAVFILRVYRRSVCPVVTLQDISMEIWSDTSFCPHRLTPAAGELEGSWKHTQGKHGPPSRAASLQLYTVEKCLDEVLAEQAFQCLNRKERHFDEQLSTTLIPITYTYDNPHLHGGEMCTQAVGRRVLSWHRVRPGWLRWLVDLSRATIVLRAHCVIPIYF